MLISHPKDTTEHFKDLQLRSGKKAPFWINSTLVSLAGFPALPPRPLFPSCLAQEIMRLLEAKWTKCPPGAWGLGPVPIHHADDCVSGHRTARTPCLGELMAPKVLREQPSDTQKYLASQT